MSFVYITDIKYIFIKANEKSRRFRHQLLSNIAFRTKRPEGFNFYRMFFF